MLIYPECFSNSLSLPYTPQKSIDLLNDGTFPGKSEIEFLVKKDTAGVIVQTGMHEESQTPIYMVDFANSIVR